MGYPNIENLDKAHLEHYLTAMIEKTLEHIIKKNPDMKLTDDDKKDLVQNIVKIMMTDPNRSEVAKTCILSESPSKQDCWL